MKGTQKKRARVEWGRWRLLVCFFVCGGRGGGRRGQNTILSQSPGGRTTVVRDPKTGEARPLLMFHLLQPLIGRALFSHLSGTVYTHR